MDQRRSATTSTPDGWRLASWYAQAEEGSRLVGEGCYFIDTVSWWLDQDPVSVFAAATGDPDDTASTLLYPDGSVATIAYQTGATPAHPRSCSRSPGSGSWPGWTTSNGSSCRRPPPRPPVPNRRRQGQKQELDAFVRAVAGARAMPIPLESLVATTLATFAAACSLASRRLEAVAGGGPAEASSGLADDGGTDMSASAVRASAGQHVASGDGLHAPAMS